ncbi:MAG: hypothetical protein JXO51_01060 [Candidatus Aminicenantes bacterium]|nr:hypothetical protein [Candidatus Aminicenantes bacterium]
MNKKHVCGLVLLMLATSGTRTLGSETEASTLATMLRGAAAYCEKLKKAAFKYVCLEQVTETMGDPTGKKSKNVYEYDYQILWKEGKANERRILIRENGEPRHVENAQLTTRIFSYYSFYLPVFLLARENQDKYDYQLQPAQEGDGENVRVLTATLKEFSGGAAVDGRIWLDGADFSVIQIEMNPRYFSGFEHLQKQALKMGATLTLSDIHRYDLARNGIRFPSRTEIRETYLMSGPPPGSHSSSPRKISDFSRMSGGSGVWDSASQRWEFDRSRTVFDYSRHRFFEVDMEYSVGLPPE